MSVSLLTTKLFFPPARHNHVPRPRLIERVCVGLRGPLTLVSAPAGYGKTALMSEWRAGPGQAFPTAWLSLDANDGDLVLFMRYLAAALGSLHAGLVDSTSSLLESAQLASPNVILTSLVNELSTFPGDFALVLDDYHVLASSGLARSEAAGGEAAIHDAVSFLLDHAPPQMHLALVTREDPPLPLARWRARGQTVEIRQADLAFTEHETADLMREMMQFDLSASDIAALQRRTEGWAAGLQLAALSFRGHADVHQLVQSFTGSHRYILDYLIGEVFERQTPDVQDFLLKTSVLDRFTAPLCDAVRFGLPEPFGDAQTPGGDGSGRGGQENGSYRTLLELDQANLFIVPLDQSRQWYRYHHLFADLLRQRLRITGRSGLASTLHRRASRWYEANGWPEDAVQHALHGEDWERAAALILGLDATLLKRGEVATLLGWFRALPDEVVRANPRLCNAYSWPLILTDQVETAESYLECAEQGVTGQEQADRVLLGQIAIARVHIARGRGDGARVIELAARALELLPRESLSERSITAMNLGIAQWHSGRLAEAGQALEEARRAAAGSENHYVLSTALVFTNKIEGARGKLRRAAKGCRQIVERGGRAPIVALAHYDLARLHYEWNDLEAAAGHARQGIELSRRSASPEFLARGHATLALVEQALGRHNAALASLGQAGLQMRHPGLTPGARLHYLTQQILVSLAQGELDRAAKVADQAPALEEAGSFPGYLYLSLALARLLYAQQEWAAVRERLSALHEMATRTGWQPVLVCARAQQALAASTPEKALAFLGEALALAEPEEYVRTFVDLGKPMRELLLQVPSTMQDCAPAYTSSLLSAFETETEQAAVRAAPAAPPVQPLIEPLSERELQVLALLAEGQMRSEIARELVVSVNTIKAHLKGIYGKLGVHDRRAAVECARELGLLP